VPYSLPDTNHFRFLEKCHTFAVYGNNGGATVGRFWQAHPAYGINGGSTSGQKYTRTIVNSNATSSGYAARFIIRRTKMKFTLVNGEAFPVSMTAVAYPSIQASTLSVSNYSTDLIGCVSAKTVVVQKVGVAGNIRSLTISFDNAQLEGLDPIALQQTSFWCTYTAASSLYQAVYLQIVDATATNTFGAANLAVLQEAEYDCETIGGANTTVTV
jgi:hypothetical protein